MRKQPKDEPVESVVRPERGLGLTFVVLTLLLFAAGLMNVLLVRRAQSGFGSEAVIFRHSDELRTKIHDIIHEAHEVQLASSTADLSAARAGLADSVRAFEQVESELHNAEQRVQPQKSPLPLAAGHLRAAMLRDSLQIENGTQPNSESDSFNELVKSGVAYSALIGQASSGYATSIQENRRAEERAVYELMAIGLVSVLLFGSAALFLGTRRVNRLLRTVMNLKQEAESHQHELQTRQEELEDSQKILQKANEQLYAQKEFLSEAHERLQAITEASTISARRFEQLFQTIPAACLGFDSEGTIYDWNREATAAFGYEAYEVLHRPIWDFLTVEKDQRLAKAMVQAVFRGRVYQRVELNITTKGGETRSFLVSVFPLKDENQNISGAISACVDITESKHRQEEIQRSAHKFESVVGSLQESLMMVNPETKVIVANENACKFLQMSRQEVLSIYLDSLSMQTIGPDGEPLDRSEWPVMKTLRTGKRCINEVLGVRDEYSGQVVWLNLNSMPVFGSDGEGLIGAVVSFSDITAKRQQEQALMEAYSRLENLATTDGLTGLVNHRTFHEKLEEELLTNSKEPISLIILDVDHFKIFNDTCGHPAGDQVLRTVAGLIQKASPSRAIAARYGGEEFAVILPGCGRASALAAAESIRHTIESHFWPVRGVTVSLGLISSDGGVAKSADIITKADQALYHSKRVGRNRVTLFEDITELEDRRKAA